MGGRIFALPLPSTATNDTDFYYIGEVPMTEDATFTDSVADSSGNCRASQNQHEWPRHQYEHSGRRLTAPGWNGIQESLEPGTLQFTGIRGTHLAMKEFQDHPTTTVLVSLPLWKTHWDSEGALARIRPPYFQVRRAIALWCGTRWNGDQ